MKLIGLILLVLYTVIAELQLNKIAKTNLYEDIGKPPSVYEFLFAKNNEKMSLGQQYGSYYVYYDFADNRYWTQESSKATSGKNIPRATTTTSSTRSIQDNVTTKLPMLEDRDEVKPIKEAVVKTLAGQPSG